MPDVFVLRGDATHRGSDVVDPLLTTIEVCLARGRNELDEQASGLQDVSLVCLSRANLRLGQVCQVVDLLDGSTWYGKLTGIQHQYTKSDCVSTLAIRRPSVKYE